MNSVFAEKETLRMALSSSLIFEPGADLGPGSEQRLGDPYPGSTQRRGDTTTTTLGLRQEFEACLPICFSGIVTGLVGLLDRVLDVSAPDPSPCSFLS
mmetsp:Transcript_2773/g.6486  ORF Transcript_2773/g.6486 Transcript_2773/m.6486 type:complete len:98 (+) Transcript_2773:716-1009(+)